MLTSENRCLRNAKHAPLAVGERKVGPGLHACNTCTAATYLTKSMAAAMAINCLAAAIFNRLPSPNIAAWTG